MERCRKLCWKRSENSQKKRSENSRKNDLKAIKKAIKTTVKKTVEKTVKKPTENSPEIRHKNKTKNAYFCRSQKFWFSQFYHNIKGVS